MNRSHGEVSEWFKELVLKTSDAKAPRVRISASPPFFYYNLIFMNSEKYSRGRRGAPAKGVGRATGARVQISPSPPYKKNIPFGMFFLYFRRRDLNKSAGGAMHDTPRARELSKCDWLGGMYGKTAADASTLYGAKLMRCG